MQKKPNILIILCDQLTNTALRVQGNNNVDTPNLDDIIKNGVYFENNYCASPVCGPSRNSLATARMPYETGVKINGDTAHPSIPKIGGIFRNAGYDTACAGRFAEDGKADNDIDGLSVVQIPRSSPDRQMAAESDNEIATAAVDYLKTDHENPFVLFVNFENPHDSGYWMMKEPDKDPVPADFPPLPANFEVNQIEPDSITHSRLHNYYRGESVLTGNWSNDQWRRYLHQYNKLVESVDFSVGRVMKALKSANIEDNTIVVFTADHGSGNAAHKWASSLQLYQECVKVPLSISWPGQIPEGVVDTKHLISGIDFLPTICDYAGITPPVGISGISIRSVIENPETSGREFVVSEMYTNPEDRSEQGEMIRTNQYSYSLFSRGVNREMLFDLLSDPGETNDLSRIPEKRDVLEAHRLLLTRWRRLTGNNKELEITEKKG